MLIQKSLENFGLTKKETKIYLACLELGSATILDISKRVSMARSTVYSVLESLMKKDLVFTFIKQKKKHFSAEDPRKIMNIAQSRAKTIESIFPDLREMYNTAKNKPKITYYEGINQIREMYNKILKEKGLKEYYIIASEKDWLQMDKQFFEKFKKRRARARIKTKLILETSDISIDRKKQEKETYSEVKLLPKNLNWPFGAGMYILPNKIILTAYKKEHISVEIESKEMANFQRMIFEFMWNTLD